MGMFLNLALEAERAAVEKTSSEISCALSVEREAEALIESSRSNLAHLSEEHKPLDQYAEVEADARTIARRRRVLSMLENNPRIRYAVISDTNADPDDVMLTLAIRDVGTCELAIPKAKYDAFKVLRVIEKTTQQAG